MNFFGRLPRSLQPEPTHPSGGILWVCPVFPEIPVLALILEFMLSSGRAGMAPL